ncbi:MAG: NAD/NADP octopine/nopaline dehydrogenase family protein [Devosia sp.]
MRVAVLGNSPLNIGVVLAADLAALGHDVALWAFSDQDDVASIISEKGLAIADNGVSLACGRAGAVPSPRLPTTCADALDGAQVVFLDPGASAIEARVEEITPCLARGQHIHIECHGYWAALRAHCALGGVDGVTLSEGTTPTHAGGFADGVVTPHVLRRNLALGVFPAAQTEAVAKTLSSLLPIFDPKADVIATNLESMNFLVHPAIALLNAGAFDRAEEKGEPIDFYGEGNTHHASVLADALDGERRPLLDAFGYPFRSLPEQIGAIYDATGTTTREAVASAPFYKVLPPLPASIWRAWLSTDMPFAHVPYVRLSEALGSPAPLHRGLVDIVGAILGRDFWIEGLTLDRLGLNGMDAKQLRVFVQRGTA